MAASWLGGLPEAVWAWVAVWDTFAAGAVSLLEPVPMLQVMSRRVARLEARLQTYKADMDQIQQLRVGCTACHLAATAALPWAPPPGPPMAAVHLRGSPASGPGCLTPAAVHAVWACQATPPRLVCSCAPRTWRCLWSPCWACAPRTSASWRRCGRARTPCAGSWGPARHSWRGTPCRPACSRRAPSR